MKFLDDFDTDERGTALTELVITLPVFVTIFIGIHSLSTLQQGATQAHFSANRLMWENVMEVMESEPTSEWADISQCNTPCVLDHSDAHGNAAAAGQSSLTGYVWGALWYADPVPVYDDEGEIVSYLQDSTRPAINHGALLARNPRLEPFTRVRAGAWNVSSEFAWGAGSRYGEVEGVGKKSVSVPQFETTFEFTYYATAPPRPLDTGEESMWSVAVPRLSAVGEGLLGLDHDVFEPIARRGRR